jgi:hypothetical protein
LGFLLLFVLVPAGLVYVYWSSRLKVHEAQTNAKIDLRESEIKLSQEQHKKEVDNINVANDAKMKALEGEANAKVDLKEREIKILQDQHKKEVDILEAKHRAELKAQAEVAEAKIQAEHDKGLVADYVQPWIDWFRGSEVKGGAGPVSVEIKPKR